jgi:adenylate kinase family enzyme
MWLLLIGLAVLGHQIYSSIMKCRKKEFDLFDLDVNHKKILLIGQAGAGKSTLGKELASTYGLFHIDFDQLIYGENWVRRSYQEVKELTGLLTNFGVDGFVLEGSYHDANDVENVRGQVLDDLICRLVVNKVIWLDVWTSVRIYRIIKRSIGRYFGLIQQGASKETWSGVKRMLTKQLYMSEYSRDTIELEWRKWVNSGLCSQTKKFDIGIATTIRCMDLDNPM